jgi:hypothetical protein
VASEENRIRDAGTMAAGCEEEGEATGGRIVEAEVRSSFPNALLSFTAAEARPQITVKGVEECSAAASKCSAEQAAVTLGADNEKNDCCNPESSALVCSNRHSQHQSPLKIHEILLYSPKPAVIKAQPAEEEDRKERATRASPPAAEHLQVPKRLRCSPLWPGVVTEETLPIDRVMSRIVPGYGRCIILERPS